MKLHARTARRAGVCSLPTQLHADRLGTIEALRRLMRIGLGKLAPVEAAPAGWALPVGRELGLRHLFTEPYRLRTDSKA